MKSRWAPVPWNRVSLDDPFWTPRQAVNREVTIPLEYRLNKKTGAIGAHQWTWWTSRTQQPPWRIWVGDLGKWIEAASYSLATHPDRSLENRVETVIRSIARGQKSGGYLFPNPMRRDQVFTNLQEYHELYEIGHDIEGAVAHYQATGRRTFLDVACRAADFVARKLGPGPGRKRGYPGHPEIELALVKLFRATGNRRYLDLARFFILERGRQPSYFKAEARRLKKSRQPFFNWYGPGRGLWYCLAHKPLHQQHEAAGHAVRALYLYSGAADVAAETGDRKLLATCRRLWQSVSRKRLYVIGGAGSIPHGEAFTFDYDLPNETAYAETCASVALVFFAHRMAQIEVNGEYADVMERALYNNVLSGVSLDGQRFFYANHLEVHPQALEGIGGHQAAVRQKWFGCACCPPNVARLLASLGQYIYSSGTDSVAVHLFAGSSTSVTIGRTPVRIRQTTQYPWKERVRLSISPDSPVRFTLNLRIPGWCRAPRLAINGKSMTLKGLVRNGYAAITRTWRKQDHIDLVLPMPVERIESHPSVRMNAGCIALQRGPVVYCLEQVDNGPDLADITLPDHSPVLARWNPRLLGGCITLHARGTRRHAADWKNTLYRPADGKRVTVQIQAIPYHLWCNRAPGEMRVWIHGG